MDSLTDSHRDHRRIIELLPDFAIGALDDAELDEVASHLETCPDCRRELRLNLQIVGALSEQPAPSPLTRGRLLERARGADSRPALPVPETVSLPPLIPRSGVVPPPPATIAPWRRARAPLALALAAALLVLAFGLSGLDPVVAPGSDAVIANIVATAPFFPLSDSELTPPASGVLFAAADSTQAVLLAKELPPLPADRQYQIWLFTNDGERVSGGDFVPAASGRAEVLIETDRPILAYAAVAVSAEPVAGSQAPTSPLAFGGWISQTAP